MRRCVICKREVSPSEPAIGNSGNYHRRCVNRMNEAKANRSHPGFWVNEAPAYVEALEARVAEGERIIEVLNREAAHRDESLDLAKRQLKFYAGKTEELSDARSLLWDFNVWARRLFDAKGCPTCAQTGGLHIGHCEWEDWIERIERVAKSIKVEGPPNE